MKERLPDFWWVTAPRFGPNWHPQAYVCPLLMTLSCWLYRLRGKDAHWSDGRKDENGEWVTIARVLIGHGEAQCLFPRWMILVECEFRNFGVSRRFFQEVGWMMLPLGWKLALTRRRNYGNR